jgi:hypothetical protein
MAVYLPNGSKFYIGSAYAADKTFTSASNASECVLSFAADPGLAANDYVEITCGWEEIDGNVYRVKSVAGAGPYTATLEGLVTTDTAIFPSGGAANGTVREVSTWTEITQVETPSTSGGEQQFINYQLISANRERRLPSYRSAQGLQLTFFDDPTLAWYDEVLAASNDNQNDYTFKIDLKSGAKIVTSGYWSLQKMPQMSANTPMKATIDVAIVNDTVRYAT